MYITIATHLKPTVRVPSHVNMQEILFPGWSPEEESNQPARNRDAYLQRYWLLHCCRVPNRGKCM